MLSVCGPWKKEVWPGKRPRCECSSTLGLVTDRNQGMSSDGLQTSGRPVYKARVSGRARSSGLLKRSPRFLGRDTSYESCWEYFLEVTVCSGAVVDLTWAREDASEACG